MFRNPLLTGAITAIGLAVGMLICDWITQHPHSPRITVAVVFGCVYGLVAGLGTYWSKSKTESKN